MQKLLACLMTALLLSGCVSDDSEKVALQAKISVLQQQLNEQQSTRQAELEYLEKQASIASACDSFPFRLCSVTLTETGRKAQAEGISGSSSPWYWLAIGLQSLVAGLFVASLGVGISFGVKTLLRPQKDAIEAAKKLVDTAIEQATSARDQERESVNTEKRINACVTETKKELETLEIEVGNLRTQLVFLKSEIKTLNDLKKSLEAFD